MWLQQYLLWCLWTLTLCSGLSLNENNGYTGLVVAISENIAASDTLLQELQVLIQQTSQTLYTASEHHVYIADVQIVVPRSWGTSYDNASISFEDADIRIDVQNLLHGDIPYTHQVRPCGERGEYIQVTPGFVEGDADVIQRTGDAARALVHEWAHYRWGVFEEYGYPQDTLYPYFYKDPLGYWIPTGCNSSEISGELSTISVTDCSVDGDGIYEDDCRFYPNPESNQESNVSMMYMHNLSTELTFCTEETHNVFARNKQNALCGYRSVWEVLRGHGDFASTASNEVSPPDTNFTVVQPVTSTALNLYILLDISNNQTEKLNTVTSGLKSLIQRLPDDTRVGLATYTGLRNDYVYNEFQPLSELGPDRELLLDQLSSIKADTQRADPYQALINVTQRTGDASDVILFFTQFLRGAHQETDAIPSLVEHNIRVFGIAFDSSSSAPNMFQICLETKGRYFLATPPYTTVIEQALQAAESGNQAKNQLYQVENTNVVLSPEDPTHEELVYIEEVLGKDVSFIMTSSPLLYYEIASPAGEVYNSTNKEICSNNAQRETVCKFSEAETGNWTVQLTYLNDSCGQECQPLEVSLRVYSYQLPNATDPPSIQIWTSGENNDINLSTTDFLVFVELTLNGYPIANALVTVYVRDSSSGSVYDYIAQDDGIDPDITANDGVYVAIFGPLSANPLTLDVSLQSRAPTDTETRTHSLWGILPIDQDNYCCGSSSMQTETYTFHRIMEDVLTVRLSSLDSNNLPPQMIHDLEVMDVTYGVETEYVYVTLNWTSPSPRDDTEKVQNYQLYYSYDVRALVPNVTCCPPDVVDGSLEPLPEGRPQTVTVSVQSPSDPASVYFRIGSSNKHKMSKYSPLAYEFIHQSFTTTTTEPTTSTTEPITSTTTEPTTSTTEPITSTTTEPTSSTTEPTSSTTEPTSSTTELTSSTTGATETTSEPTSSSTEPTTAEFSTTDSTISTTKGPGETSPSRTQATNSEGEEESITDDPGFLAGVVVGAVVVVAAIGIAVYCFKCRRTKANPKSTSHIIKTRPVSNGDAVDGKVDRQSSGIFNIYSGWNGEEFVDLENPKNSDGKWSLVSESASGEPYGNTNEGFEGEIDPQSGEFKRRPSDLTTEL